MSRMVQFGHYVEVKSQKHRSNESLWSAKTKKYMSNEELWS